MWRRHIENHSNDILTSPLDFFKIQLSASQCFSFSLLPLPWSSAEHHSASEYVNRKELTPSSCDRHFFALKGTFPFIDIGTPETYSQAAAFFEEQAA